MDCYAMKKILFVTPELYYTGAQRMVLLMSKTAIELGYEVSVWSNVSGPYEKEYQSLGIDISVVPSDHLHRPDIVRRIKQFDLAICNTINTDAFARVCCRYIPTVWYIHEADNLLLFINGNERRLDWLKHSHEIICVSEYAAKIIKEYTSYDVPVVKNCVEDVADRFPSDDSENKQTVKFIQLGYIEAIKGYDVLLDAFLKLSPQYQNQVKLFFAGRVSPRTKTYADQIINMANEIEFVTYFGDLSADEALKAISEMDVVIVASRGESCSMVALEGAMLSKPLILTENVGAKYMVRGDNGYIVKTGDSDSLKDAIEKMIDRKDQLKDMGKRSRAYYEKMASFDTYRTEMAKLFLLCEKKGTPLFILECVRNRIITSDILWGLRALRKYGIKYTFKHTIARMCLK